MEFTRTFRDALERPWTVDIDIRNDDIIESVTGVSIINLIPTSKKAAKDAESLDALGEFLSNPHAVFEAFYLLIKPQADALGIDRAGVKSGMDGGAVDRMGGAMLKAIHDFFPKDPARQAILRRVAKMGQEIASKLADRAEREMDKMDLDAMIASLPGIDAKAFTGSGSEPQKKPASGTPDTLASSQAR